MRSTCTAFAVLLAAILGLCVAGDPASLPAAPVSPAERVARLTRLVEDSEKERDELLRLLASPTAEYALAEADFNEIDRALTDTKKALARATADKNAADAAKLTAELAKVQKRWDSRRVRFNLAIDQRKAMLDKLALLKTQIEKDKELLAMMEGKAEAVGPALPAPPTPPAPATPATSEAPTTPAAPPKPILATLMGVPIAAPAAAAPTAPTGKATPAVESKELRLAREKAAAERAESEKAREHAEELERRVKLLEQSLRIETKMLETEKDTVDKTTKLLDTLQRALARAAEEQRDVAQLMARIRDTEERLNASRNRVEAMTTRVAALGEELTAAREEQAEADALAARSGEEAEQAQEYVAELLSPLRPQNLFKKLAEHGPAVFAILVAMFVLHLMVRQFARSVVLFMVRNNNRGSEQDCENRASTLVGVFRYAATLIVFGGGAVMVLDEVGVPVVPLMGGAAVVGLAVAFGAQNLIRDYFTGFMILMEDQYGINDVVKIGAVSGTVEKITLRVTVLRDLEGVLHFIPHGTITNVSNMTHSWSRAAFTLTVGLNEDVDKIMAIIRAVGTELRYDPMFVTKINEDLEMLGVNKLDATGVELKFLIKTRAMHQWAVKREMLKRVHKRFLDAGIYAQPNAQKPAIDVAEPTVISNRVAVHLNGHGTETGHKAA